MNATLTKQFEGFAECCLELARSAEMTESRARFIQMAREYRLATLRITRELSSHLRPGNADHNGGTIGRATWLTSPTLLDHPRPDSEPPKRGATTFGPLAAQLANQCDSSGLNSAWLFRPSTFLPANAPLRSLARRDRQPPHQMITPGRWTSLTDDGCRESCMRNEAGNARRL